LRAADSPMNDGHHTITPIVSVVMPTYNGEKFLRPAIESILEQTFTDFELIVIDDASTDTTPRILAEFRDDRLLLFRNDCNLGIAGATNKGLAVARGEYLALQDHDDVSLPHRFQTQVAFLTAHPDVALVGSNCILIDGEGARVGIQVQPEDDLVLRWELLVRNPLHNTSIMARLSAIRETGGYSADPSFHFAEDYDFISRLAMRHRVANIKEPLVLWRRHSTTATWRNQSQQTLAAGAISFCNLCELDEMAASGNGARQKRAEAEELYLAYLGLRAFLLTPPRQFPTLPPEQVISGMKYLCEIRATFYRCYSFPRSAVTKHRRVLNWTWGKHAVALAVRAPWDWRSRLQIFFLGVRCLLAASFAAFWSPGTQPEEQR
jgi:glycosyltransferase involved in cell wall biosynthesis